MDSWWCAACKGQFPTHAFTCKHPDCGNWVVGFGDYCEEHQPAEHPRPRAVHEQTPDEFQQRTDDPERPT